MNNYVAEFIGTMLLILLGNGVVCNVVLSGTKGKGAGWIVIAVGWGIAVFCGATVSKEGSGAHLNPALTLGLVAAGKFSASLALGYILAQIAGAMAGAALVYGFYRSHFQAEPSADSKLACFATSPALPGKAQAFFCEAIATFALVFTILLFQSGELIPASSVEGETAASNAETLVGLGTVDLLPVTLLVIGIGLSLGGTTGYAINPARDFGPRLVHAIVPIPGKRDSDWSYAWVPIMGPIAGGILAAALYLAIQ
jgi:glycerol uptake facilitator protein